MEQTNRETLGLFAKAIKSELLQWRESMEYWPIETFTGCVLARLKSEKLITAWEESILRQKILGD